MLGWADVFSIEVVWSFVVVCALGLALALVMGVRRFRWPRRDEAVARVDALLPGRPIATMSDSQAIGRGDAASEAVWRAHLRRMAERTRGARAAEPDLRVSTVDPFGLRYVALLFFIVSLAFGSVWRVGGLGGGTANGGALASGPVWEGWIEPPAYTGKPSLYLADIPRGAISVPVGSTITLRLYGEIGALTVAETVSDRTGNDVGAASDPAQTIPIVQSGTLTISGEGGANWQISALADAPPTIEIIGTPEIKAEGEFAQGFSARDDYGVISGEARFTLDLSRVDQRYGLAAEPDFDRTLVLDLPMPITGGRTAVNEQMVEDLSQNVLANLGVTLTMSVTDAAGQTGDSPTVEMVLPGRRFFEPVAKAVIEQRRDLLWSKANAPRVLDLLRAVAHRPEDLFRDNAAYLRMSATLRRFADLVDAGLTDEGRVEIAGALWDLAIALEEGSLADARERLRRAQERLAEAMRNGASAEEIQSLMDELRAATNDYMQMLADKSEPDPNQADQPDNGAGDSMRFTMSELQALMDRIQQLMEEGRMAEAQQLMDQLNQLLENTRITQGEGGDGPRTPGQQSMQDLADSLRNQQDLSDESFRDLQRQFNQDSPGSGDQSDQTPGQSLGQQGQTTETPGQSGRQGQGQSPGSDSQQGLQDGQGQGGEAAGSQLGLADRQQALRDELARQRGGLPSLDGDAADATRRALDRAESAMNGAEQALRDGNLAQAIDQQAEAMDALRDGMRNLGEALSQNRSTEPGQGTQDGTATGRLEPTRRDPLGRQSGNTGQYGSDENMLQGPDVYRRAEDLLDELRRRSSEQDRPRLELDYLKRLLERF